MLEPKQYWIIVACTLAAACAGGHAAAAEALPMQVRSINAADAPEPGGGYSQAIEVRNARRTLYISGQIPVDRADNVPSAFEDQCRLVWQNIAAQLRAAGMSLDNIVKITAYLSDRRYRADNSKVRREVLGNRAPALTIIIADIYDESWLLEIDVVAAD